MSLYRVSISKIEARTLTFTVRADDFGAASALAIDKAENADFSRGAEEEARYEEEGIQLIGK